MIKELSLARMAILAMILAAIVMVGGMMTSIFNIGASDSIEYIVSEASKQYPEWPYTANTLPFNDTNSFANSRAISANWASEQGCPSGSRATPTSGCWSLIIDANGVNLIFPKWTRDQCLTHTNNLRPDTHRRIRYVGVANDGDGSLTNAVDLSTVLPNVRGATVRDLGKSLCRDAFNNQITVILN